jgi:hypothetical protein
MMDEKKLLRDKIVSNGSLDCSSQPIKILVNSKIYQFASNPKK